MKRTISLILILFWASILLVSCSSTEKKPLPEEARLTKKAYSIAEKLKNAYLEGNKSVFRRYCTRKGYLKIISSIKEFDHANLSFRPEWVDIDNGKLILYIRWEGSWSVNGSFYNEKGLTAFQFRLSPLLLDDILRNNPFSYPK